MSAPLEVAVLVSGRGSNLHALLSAIEGGRCDAVVTAVISDRLGAPALALAEQRGIPTFVVAAKQHPDRSSWDRALALQVEALAPALVVLAGFMRIVGPELLARFPARILNVHPALLPAFPGVDAAAQALRAGVRVSGCTVHLVDAGVDTGPILAQAAVPVQPGDDAATLHARIQRAEHRLLPAVVHAISRGALQLTPAPRWELESPPEEHALFAPALP